MTRLFGQMKLRSYLIALVVAAVLPLMIFASRMIVTFKVLASFIGRRISKSIAALSRSVPAPGQGEISRVSDAPTAEENEVARALEKAAVERKRAEEVRSQLVAIVESSNDAIVGRTLDGTITSWNKGAEKIFGYRAEEAIGRSITMLFPTDQTDLVKRNSESIRQGRSIEPYEGLRLRKDGACIHVSATVSPVKDESGNIIGVSSIARDITERKLAEEQRMELLTRNEALVQASAEIIYDWRPPIDEFRWEGDFGRILGYTPAEMGADTASWTSRVHPDDLDRVLREVEECTRERRPYDLEYRFRRSDDSYTWMHDRGMPLVNSEGRLERMVGLFRDITERKRAEKELRTSRERLRSLAAYLQSVREEERSRIARELHDEIGQALTGIKFSLETSMRGLADDDKAVLGEALRSTNELIGRVRDLSLELRPTMLDDLGLLPALRWHLDRYTTQFDIKVDFKHAGLEGRRLGPEAEIAAYRIVQEALTNVARHAKIDKVDVSVSANEGAIRMRIHDKGAGFDPHSLSFSATGGLSGMRERATLLDGWLKIDSAPGSGVLVSAELPLKSKASASRRTAGESGQGV